MNKAIILVRDDGAKHFVGLVPSYFDTQAWANKQSKNFNLIGIIKIIEQTVQ
jgi:hypothetical protein